MSDGWVWLRCLGCGHPVRFLTFSGGEWGPWSGVDGFIAKHVKECQGERLHDVDQSRGGYSFFEIVNEKDMDVSELGFERVNEMIRDPKRLV